VLIFAIKENQVREGLWWEWWISKQEIKFLEASTGISLDVH
jgi:hypothetical protein